jgi:hypothetical protein
MLWPAWMLIAVWAGAADSVAADPAPAQRIEAGRVIYVEGRLPSGKPLAASRQGGTPLTGPAAACVQCHQRSGMGLAEGAVVVPPVAGPALFGTMPRTGQVPRRAPGMVFRDYSFRTRPPYDERTLAHAIRSGRSPAGSAFSVLMPRYDLDDDAMESLIAYLRTLSAHPSPGADGQVAHFATVVTPDVEPERREAMLGVLKTCFAERYPADAEGASIEAASDPRQIWRLHVWDLERPPDSWGKQLAEKYARQPVFALVSGLGADEWLPVERFCEQQELPCLFPNAHPAAPSAPGRYSFYFSRGVWLEAEVFARQLRARRVASRPMRVVQLIGGAGLGQRAAGALEQALADTGMAVTTLRWDQAEAGLAVLAADDALILWLSEAELSALMRRLPAPPKLRDVLVSGVLSGMEAAPLNAAWRKAAVLAYAFDPPARWQQRMQRNLRPWLVKHGLPRVDERLQGNTLAACNLLAESMLRLRGNYLRDYLVEWVENYPSAMGNAPAPQAYPRFSLGPGQRVSSKGAYLVRFVGPSGHRIEPLQEEWIIP